MTRPAWWRLAAYVLVVAMFAVSLWRIQGVIDDEQHEDRLEDAERCVEQHGRVAILRDVIERSTGRGAHAAATAVGRVATRLFDPGDLPPDLLDQLSAEADAQAAAEAELILVDYPDPDCDRGAAERLLGDE